MAHCCVTCLLAFASLAVALRQGKSSSGSEILIMPPRQDLHPVGVVMIPGALVPPSQYMVPMKKWQQEAEQAGISLWVTIQSYWLNTPLPIRTVANVRNRVQQMRDNGLPQDAPVYYTGHSMGAGANLPPIDTLYREGTIKGCIMQAAYILHEYQPPMAESWNWPTPTLTVGGDMNFGSSRITRMAEAVYNQPEDTQPVVVIEGMNHMQFATDFKKEDLKPYISEAEAQLRVAKASIDWIARQEGQSAGAYLKSETQRTKVLVTPIIEAYEYEGSRMFNVPNQFGTPNNSCPNGVCPEGSQFIKDAQAFVATSEVAKSASVQSNFADLRAAATSSPFINGNSIQSFAMVGGDNAFFEKDFNEPHHPGDMWAKLVSRQSAVKTLLGRSAPVDADLCRELNQVAYDFAKNRTGLAAIRRYNENGQFLVFDDTSYQSSFFWWSRRDVSWTERNSEMRVQSAGLFAEQDGTHFCKLLSPARAIEWIYVDGLKAKLWKIW